MEVLPKTNEGRKLLFGQISFPSSTSVFGTHGAIKNVAIITSDPPLRLRRSLIHRAYGAGSVVLNCPTELATHFFQRHI